MTLGEFLRHEREKKGITLEQVASATKIGIRILHSLEGDRFSELPAKPFIRGFVISYCRFIEIDSKEVLSQFDQFLNQKVTERPNRDSGHSGYAFEKKDAEQQSRLVLFLTMCSFLMIGGLVMLIFKPSLHRHRKSNLEKLRTSDSAEEVAQNSETVSLKMVPKVSALNPSASLPLPVPGVSSSVVPLMSAVPTPLPSLSPSPLPSSSPAPLPSDSSSLDTEKEAPAATPAVKKEKAAAPSPEPSVTPQAGMPSADPKDPLDSGLTLKPDEIHHKVVFHVLSDIWVRYRVDHRPIRIFIIRKGRILVLRAKEQIQFQVSNPKSVMYSYNHQPTKALMQGVKAPLKNENFTLQLPPELPENIREPLPEGHLLPKTADPENNNFNQL